jgi:hypothetical protein
MGDLRAGYRFLAPALRTAGYRVACTDLRGHGDSDARFPSYGDEETAGDIAALISELGGPAVIVGLVLFDTGQDRASVTDPGISPRGGRGAVRPPGQVRDRAAADPDRRA